MYSDGLEIAGIGVGMVFLALVSILILILVLRFAIDTVEGRIQQRQGASPAVAAREAPPSIAAPTPETPTTPAPAEPATGDSQDRAARAAAVAVAIFMSEESERKD